MPYTMAGKNGVIMTKALIKVSFMDSFSIILENFSKMFKNELMKDTLIKAFVIMTPFFPAVVYGIGLWDINRRSKFKKTSFEDSISD